MQRNRKPWTSLAPLAIAFVAATTLIACSEATTSPEEVFTPPVFGFGNGAPKGSHYSLNWIGVQKGKTADMTGNNGHRIFFPLWGTAKVLLCQSGRVPPATLGTLTCPTEPVFQVRDANATEGDNLAAFALPNPIDPTDVTGSTTIYSVYVRALGTPGGHATNTTCGMGAGPDLILGTQDDEEVCSVIQLVLDRNNKSTGGTTGKTTFSNVTKYMLYVYADLDNDISTAPVRIPLFDDRLINYFWQYDNAGLKLAQFRFYPCSSIVPVDTGGSTTTTCT